MLFIICCFIIGTATIQAQTITGVQKGSSVILNGSGFASNENISMQVVYLDNTRFMNALPWVVTTDEKGAFVTTQNIAAHSNEPIDNLKITAHARTSGAWVQYFLDGVTPTLIGSKMVAQTNNAVKNNPAPPPLPSENLIDCTGFPDPGNTLVTTNPTCANTEFTLSLQNSGGTGVGYQWQANTGAGFADIPGATDEIYTTSQSVGTDYQCVVTCTNSSLSTTSTSLLVSVANPSGCALTVTPGGTATQIAEKLLGPGVTVYNAVINCTSNAYGTFTGGLTSLGLSDGIVLTSGSAVDLIGPNNSAYQSTDNIMPGDPDLEVLTTSTTFDACTISFDFVAACDNIAFNYIFGSEEYPEFVNSQFNDVFAFFISGPGISGVQNIALVPGANIPIEINNVNDGYTIDCPDVLPGPCTNCEYYVNNCTGNTVQYDGYTTLLAASSAVTPGQTYHLKIGISDAGDPVYDSGVMLQSSSLSCVSTAVVESDAFRGCQDGQVRFCRTGATTEPATIHYTIGGSAVNGVDYNLIADSIVIPAGQQCATLYIVPALINTGVTKTVVLTTTDLLVLTVNISDGVSITASVVVEEICGSSEITMHGADTYTWSPSIGLTETTGEEVIASPPVTTTYTIVGRITESGCSDTITVTIDAGQQLYKYYRDVDGDSYGNINVKTYTCSLTPPSGYVSNSTDCNDANELINPGATEICGNNIDDNCNGEIDENCSGCYEPTNLSIAKITENSAKLIWYASPGALNYKVRYKVANTNGWTVIAKITNTSKTIEDLLPLTEYACQVKSVCSKNPKITSLWGTKVFFTTEANKLGAIPSIQFEVYPNPFESFATISYSLTMDANVRIDLFDVAGQLMQQVSNENMPAGSHTTALNCSQLSPGVYLVKLQVNESSMIKKIVMIK